MNSDLSPPAKDSTLKKEEKHIIIGVIERIEYEPLSEYSTHSDRVTNIGSLLFRMRLLCLRQIRILPFYTAWIFFVAITSTPVPATLGTMTSPILTGALLRPV